MTKKKKYSWSIFNLRDKIILLWLKLNFNIIQNYIILYWIISNYINLF